MTIQLTNTLTRRKEPFVPADPSRVTMYVCGPTVYNYAHIGNMRPPVVFDVLFRLLRHTYGENAVLYARNYTDIDDRIIKLAIESGQPMSAITEKFAKIYDEDTGALGVLTPTHQPRATENVDGMIKLIEKLIENGSAYKVSTGVYFSVASDADYGKLSNRAQEDLQAGARVEGEDDKRHPSDFALWKTTSPGEPSWEAPFGAGRPGWHIECSAMIDAELGSPIDIHGGGLDLIFPHHENEIAQSESAHGHPLARVWMHNGFLTMDTTKMSKSLGNVITPRELIEQGGWKGEELRWALLSAHYRAPLDWNEDLLKQSRANLDRLYQTLRDVKAFGLIPWSSVELGQLSEGTEQVLAPFYAALRDDLNTPLAMKEMFAIGDLLRSARNEIAHGRPTPLREMRRLWVSLLEAGKAIGLLQSDPDDWFHHTIRTPHFVNSNQFYQAAIDQEKRTIQDLVQRRDEARRAKDWKLADQIRRELTKRWASVQDGKDAATWSSALDESNFWRLVSAFISHASDRVQLEASLPGGKRADAIVEQGGNFILVESKLSLREQGSLAGQIESLVRAAAENATPVSSILIVAPNTAANTAAVSSAEWRSSIAGLETRFVTINGLGEPEVDFVIPGRPATAN